MEILGERPAWSMSGSEKLSTLDAVQAELARLETYALHLIADLHESEHAKDIGAGNTGRLLSLRYRINPAEAHRQVALAKALAKYPTISAALPNPAGDDPSSDEMPGGDTSDDDASEDDVSGDDAAGSDDPDDAASNAGATAGRPTFIHPRQAAAIITALEQVPNSVPTENLRSAEQQLLNLARKFVPADLSKAGKRIRDILDTDGPEPAENKAYGRESLSLTNADNGVKFHGYLACENAELFRALIDTGAKPHKTIDGAPDPRCRTKRQADALTSALTTATTAHNLATAHPHTTPSKDTPSSNAPSTNAPSADTPNSAPRPNTSSATGTPTPKTPEENSTRSTDTTTSSDTTSSDTTRPSGTPKAGATRSADAATSTNTTSSDTTRPSDTPSADATRSADAATSAGNPSLNPESSAGSADGPGTASTSADPLKPRPEYIPGHGPKAQITVTIDFNDLKSATTDAIGDLVYGDGLSAGAIRRLACDAKVIPIVLGSKSQPLDVGTTVRLVTGPMRQTLNARDKGCVACGAKPIYCEAHHIVSWIDGGTTKVTNLVLLCKRCHIDLHNGHWTIQITDDGVVHVSRPDWATPAPVPRTKYRQPDPGSPTRVWPRDTDPSWPTPAESARLNPWGTPAAVP